MPLKGCYYIYIICPKDQEFDIPSKVLKNWRVRWLAKRIMDVNQFDIRIRPLGLPQFYICMEADPGGKSVNCFLNKFQITTLQQCFWTFLRHFSTFYCYVCSKNVWKIIINKRFDISPCVNMLLSAVGGTFFQQASIPLLIFWVILLLTNCIISFLGISAGRRLTGISMKWAKRIILNISKDQIKSC